MMMIIIIIEKKITGVGDGDRSGGREGETEEIGKREAERGNTAPGVQKSLQILTVLINISLLSKIPH